MNKAIIVHVVGSEQRYIDVVLAVADAVADAAVIAVSDGATDLDKARWEKVHERAPSVSFYVMGVALGKGAALRSGFNKCTADYVAFLDADGIVEPQCIRDCFDFLEDNKNLHGVLGNRWDRKSFATAPRSRRLASAVFAFVTRALFYFSARDPQAPLKVFRRSALQSVFEDLRLHDLGFDVELLFQLKRHHFRVVERPIVWRATPHPWRTVPTAVRVITALLYVRLLNSPLRRFSLIDLLGRPHDLRVKRSYSIMIFCWRDPRNPEAGGGEVYLHEQAKCWVAAGHRVTWFAQHFDRALPDEIIDGIRVVRRGRFPFVFLRAPLWYLLKSDRSYDFIIDCMNGIPFFTPLFSTKPKVCLLYHVHTHHFQMELPKFVGALASAVETRLTPLVYRKTRFVSISESSKREIEQYGIARLPVELIYSGVSRDLVPGAKALQPTVLYLGRLKKYKRVRKLIDAFVIVQKSIPDARLVIAGTGDDEGDLRSYAAASGARNAFFLGRVSDEEKVRLMQEAWVFGMPSSIEGWGIVVIEANACATPAIAYRVAGLRDCIADGGTGYLVDNDATFEARLFELLTRSSSLAQMSENAYQWSSQFSWEATAERTLDKIRRAQPWRAVFEPDPLSVWKFVANPGPAFESSAGSPDAVATAALLR